MVYKTIDDVLARARRLSQQRVVAIPAAADDHTLEAVIRAYQQGIVRPILIGDRSKIEAMVKAKGHSELTATILEAASDEEAAQKAVDCCRDGHAHILMKGKLDSSVFLHPVMKRDTGLRKGDTISHIAFEEIPGYHKLLAVTDSAVLAKPDLKMKQAMIHNAIDTMHNLGYGGDIKVAIITAVEKVNAKMPETQDAHDLKEMYLRGEFPGCIVEGPLSLDIATMKSAAEAKGFHSEVAGDADLVVMPDIAAGNVLVKALKFAKAKAVGYVVGGQVPIALSSRGSSVESKYLTLVFTAVAVNLDS